MNDTIHYTICPCCKEDHIEKVMLAKDHTVTGELFEIWKCNNCSVRFTQNVPSQEAIAKYYRSEAYVSHSDTKKGFINRLYHFVRSLTVKSKKKLIIKASGKEKGNLLDIGAGTGAFAHAMQRAGWNVTALEPDATARQNALKNYDLSLQDLDSLFQLKEADFDVITLWHVLEHVHDLGGYFIQFKKLLKPTGILVIAVPNYTSYDGVHYAEHWAAYDVPRHLYHFSPHSMDLLAAQYFFRVKEYKPMWFDSFYVSMLSEKYRSGKNNFPKALWNGLRSNAMALGDTKKCSSVIYISKAIPD
jgi:2-polyprenyl-3-methyl-5-hydroxy-6-metoxy-1,4-benzoquinol methylase